MAVRSVDFLPEIFQTDTNKQFLAATVDTLIQEPRFKKIQGYIGRTVGPGVNPNDRYVVEPNKARADYQLEPGVISLDPANVQNIRRVMTYPNITDAIQFQGGNVSKPDRLYQSEYYTWDPFVNFDSFVNFSQYYWLPDGPDAVDVSATNIPATAVFDVTRNATGYSFSGVNGSNPELKLLRGGSYSFRVSQNLKQTVNIRVNNRGTEAFVINGEDNPDLVLIRGNTYIFNLNLRGGIFPFWIKTQPTLGQDDAYDVGVTRNGSDSGLVTFVVPDNAPDTLYYTSENQSNLQGQFTIQDAVPGTGPGFWIQSEPGVTGVLPSAPNISSRDVFGVNDNGEDLGIVTFDVPRKTAQAFYYNLANFAQPVDLVTGLKFNEINNQRLDTFVQTYGGIDGITSLAGRTLVFAETSTETEPGGWTRTTFFDPLDREAFFNFQTGSYDTTLFDQATQVPVEERQQLWQINIRILNGIEYLELTKIADIPELQKFTVRYGTEFSNTQWYKESLTGVERIPLLTATKDTLYYQDGLDPSLTGIITLVDDDADATLDIDDILGSSQYISPNGVAFTNGLKVVFRGAVEPATYQSGVTEFECTATTPGTNAITCDSTEDLYVGQQIVFEAPTLGGLEAGRTYFVHSIINLLQFTVSQTEGGGSVPLLFGTGTMSATAINYREYYVAGVGGSIQLLPVQDFVTPENYVVDANDSTILIEPRDPDYITIDRSSRDRNAWSRSNRWFHVDVINATAEYNDTVAVLDNRARAKRPILEFRANLRLFNSGVEGKNPVDVIDFQQVDAFSNVEGSTGYTVDGVALVNGTRVIFANDTDPDVRNKIYVVEFVSPASLDPEFNQPIINLRLASDGVVQAGQTLVCLEGTQSSGVTFWYDGVSWITAQQKTSVQQPPLFNVYDATGISFGDQIKYPSSNFEGSKLFSYAISDAGFVDEILNLRLQYLNITNVGDIVFDSNFYKDTFVFTRDNVSTTSDISQGSVRQYSSRTDFQRLLGWQKAISASEIYQQFKFFYQGAELELDVAAGTTSNLPAVKIYVSGKFLPPNRYTVTTSTTTTITLSDIYVPGEVIEVLVLSDQVSRVAFYQVPVNLENNPLNANSQSFTLGTIRKQYQSICENLPGLTGSIDGINNSRDLGNLVPYGLVILQQSAPLTLAGYFLGEDRLNVFDSLRYNAREYTKYKNLILNAVTEQELQFQTAAEILDTVIETLTQGRLENQPFYWSDMLPSGAIYLETVNTITPTSINTFDTQQVYDFTSANFRAIDVYLNDLILIRNRDYVVATDGARVTLLVDLSLGDRVTLREYTSTAGSFCPNTPTKLGLYPAWEPELVTVTGSTGANIMLRGHDGSLTVAFGDIRDDVLLEFERRIYNNLKLDGNPVPLSATDVIPGQFRNTGYTFEEINSVLVEDFLSYVAWNKLDYRTQQYRSDNEFTYNYSTAQNRLDGQDLLGAWRGIYRYFYDTTQPDLAPWEMLGFTIKPVWWERTYGAAPYTRDNLVLWDDLAAGIVRDPAGAYVKPAYVRPRLTEVLPVSEEGELLPPLQSVVSSYDTRQFRRSWSPGDGSPVEESWWNSSLYPFAVMRLLAVTRPAKFFSLFADRDRYRYNSEFDQYLYDKRYRLDANGIQVYGKGVSKASFINWIVDYNLQSGLDVTDDIQSGLRNLDVRLCYRMAGFSDKSYIKIFTEKSTPDSTNTAFLIPDQSYDLLLFKNQPFDRAVYSSILIQRVSGGYAVYGYATAQPFFNVLQTQAGATTETIAVAGATATVPRQYTDIVTRVPYGTVFDNETAVVEFILGYGQFCLRQGLTFDNIDNGKQLDWRQMAVEFLYWTQQGWGNDTLIALNPLATKLSISRADAVVDTIDYTTSESVSLDQNRKDLPTRSLNIVRLGNEFSVRPLTDNTLSFLDLKYTSYEHIIVLDNRSEFGDLLYEPITGARQSRLNITAAITADWNGSIDTPGFILNQDNVQEWESGRSYTKGEIVRFKDRFYSAANIVEASEIFNFSDWLQSDYEITQFGLLPNLANKADQLTNSYDINVSNLEVDNDLLSYGLIGFRPRPYMSALNLDDVSQINVYRQFLSTKGTVLSAELFSNADLRKETADYQIYENWAVQRAIYGASANRRFFEIRLNRSLLNANPSVIEITEPGQTASTANQTVLYTNLWRQSLRYSNKDILPTTTNVQELKALPSAGYVSLDDADITVFDLTDPNSLAADIDSIVKGTAIWVARVNEYDWNIYRANPVPGSVIHVCDNLDQTSLVFFNGQHGLSVGDTLIIKFFDSEVNGVYRVLTVPGIDKVTIAFSFTGDRTSADAIGLAFTLESMRLAQFSDVIDLSYSDDLTSGARVWVDDDGQGRWAVLEKRPVFTSLTEVFPVEEELDAGELFGSSVAQSVSRAAVMIGAPGHKRSEIDIGAVYTYLDGFGPGYDPVSPGETGDGRITLPGTDGRGFGHSVTFGNREWAAAGAPQSLGAASATDNGYVSVIFNDPLRIDNINALYAGSVSWQESDTYAADVVVLAKGAYYISVQSVPSGIDITDTEYWHALIQPNPFTNYQLLTNPDSLSDPSEFGYAVSMSPDERWLYVGSPGTNRVYAYGRVDWQDQIFTATGNGFTVDYDFGDVIQISLDGQITVSVSDITQVLGVDYTVADSQVTFVAAPAAGSTIVIRRNSLLKLDTSTPVLSYALGTSLYTATTINSFSVYVNDSLQRPGIDYSFNSGTQTITFATLPTANSNITIRAQWYWQYVDSITVSGLSSSDRFGHSVKTGNSGRQLVVGAPNASVDGETQAGAVYVFDRSVQRFIYQPGDPNIFTLSGTVRQPVAVIVNGVNLVNQTYATASAANSFAVAGNTVTVSTELSAGDIIDIETNEFRLIQTIAQNVPAEFSNYGTSVEICPLNCNLFAGAPQSSQQIYKGGVVEFLVNQAALYGMITSTVFDPVLTPGDELLVNGIAVAIPAASENVTSLQGLANAIGLTVPNTTATVSDGKITIQIVNLAASTPGNRLSVAPGLTGTAFDDLGFDVFSWSQQIRSPFAQEYAAFGYSISANETSSELVVGAPEGSMYIVVEFDFGETDFDAGATEFFALTTTSGAVYVYNFADAANASANNTPKFVFGQQLEIASVQFLDRFGAAVDYRSGLLWANAPSQDLGDSTFANYGKCFVYENPGQQPAWQVIRRQEPVVDIRLLNSVFLYDRLSSATTEFLDFFDPLQGKILGAAQQNIDYVGAVDPASYNIGSGQRGSVWAADRVGEIWWNTGSVRFIDPSQNDDSYAARRWGQVFPDSRIDVYQWIVSEQLPANYTGPGEPFDIGRYTVNTFLGSDGVINTEYFYWVRELASIAVNRGKTLSVATIARYIENPRASGIAYLAPLSSNTVSIYNCQNLIEAQDTILHVEFDQEFTDNNVHIEYELVPQNRADGFLSDNLYLKLLDSLCGVDSAGNRVPDVFLSPPERYGVLFRPRQSMVIDRFLALENYFTRANAVLKQFPIAETRVFNLLNSSEPEPSSLATDQQGQPLWNLRVANLEVLGFQDIAAVPLGYRYLVATDSTQNGLWSIYQVSLTNETLPDSSINRTLTLFRVQNFSTARYWSYIDWYRPGYKPSTRAVAEVANFASLENLSVPIGSSVKVTANAQNKFEIYLLTDLGWERVGLEDGTIAISNQLYDYAAGRFGFDIEVFDAQYFDQEPVIETRKVLQALNQEIFIDDLEIERNRLLTLMFDFILSESAAPEWLVKTSLIDVDHRIRALLPFQNFTRDNQEFVLDYIQEVKPYHVQIREFNIKYFGDDIYQGDVNDFDVPAYFNTELAIPKFTSPILLPYELGTAQASNVLSDAAANSEIWQTWPWNQWFNNYQLDLISIRITESGTGYTGIPAVTIQGDAEVPATARAVIDGFGGVLAVVITDPGSGYRSTPTVIFAGGNGSGAAAYAVMSNPLIRQFRTTIKFDRYQYNTTILPWSPDGTYEDGTLVRYRDQVWRAESSDSTAVVGPVFNLEDWIPVPASSLSGVDRTMGFYVAGVDSPGLDLPLLVEGTRYPGVQVWGDYFEPTQTLDAVYRSSFQDLFLGTRISDINVDGGEFLGAFEGHAPEELVNGSEYDTLDLRVYTRPGSDWQFDGHGFPLSSQNFEFDLIISNTFDWGDLLSEPSQVLVSNQTTRRDLTPDLDYTVDWIAHTVTMTPSSRVREGDIINVAVYGFGGGSQLYSTSFEGADIADGVFVLPVNAAEISEIGILIDGQAQAALPTFVPYIESEAWNVLESYARNIVVNNAGSYYRSLSAVPVGIPITDTTYWTLFVPTLLTQVTMPSLPAADQRVTVIVLGPVTVGATDLVRGRTYTIISVGTSDFTAAGAANNTVGTQFAALGATSGTGVASTNYGWSAPQCQYVTADATVVSTQRFALSESMQGTNPAALILTRNGRRLAPPACIEWIADDVPQEDSTLNVSYGLPQRLGESFQQSSINAATDIRVWVDDVLQTQNVGATLGDYGVTAWDGSNVPGRQVVFNQVPRPGSRIVIAVSTLADYTVDIDNDEIVLDFTPNLNDKFTVTSWNDTSQQDLLTRIWVGPVLTGVSTVQGYDTTDFDQAVFSFQPGSFDYSNETVAARNLFDLERPDVNASRLWVTLNGERLYVGQDFTVEEGYLVLAAGTIGTADVLAVTEVTDSIVPEASAFRVFQDMRGVKAVYRIDADTTTTVAQPVSSTDERIYVIDAGRLTVPNISAGILGVVTVGGERIVYREINLADNSIGSLLRGTAGTAVSDHAVDTVVTDIGIGNLLRTDQDYVISNTDLGDGSTTIFYAPNLSFGELGDSSTLIDESIEVYVGGERQLRVSQDGTSTYRWVVTDFEPVAIEFIGDFFDPVSPDPAPPAGVEITILQRRGTWWYNVETEAERNRALQESATDTARFLTGRIS